MVEFVKQVQSDKRERLLDEADERGYLTLERILEAFPEAEEEGVEAEEKSSTGGMCDDGPDLSRIPINDSVSLYFREMSHVPLLTYDEEVELAKQLERGKEAQHQLAENGHNPEEKAQLKR